MNNQSATKNSTLTYTLGKHEKYFELDYLDFLFDFASLFVVSLKNLCENKYLWETTWLEKIVEQPTTLREHIYHAVLHSDQMLDATPVKQRFYSFEKKAKPTERQSYDFSRILIRCLNLADDLIILEVLTNRYQADIIQPLQDMQSELSALIDQLTKLQTDCQTENLKASLDDLTGSYLTLFEKQLKSINWSLRNCQTAVDEIAKHYHTLWQLAFENTVRTREDLRDDRREGTKRIQSIQVEINQIWQKLFIKNKSTSPADQTSKISTDDLANFRTKIYGYRVEMYKCHDIHHPEKEKESKNSFDPVDQIEVLLEHFNLEYERELDSLSKAQKEQANVAPMVTKIINFAKLSLEQQKPNNA